MHTTHIHTIHNASKQQPQFLVLRPGQPVHAAPNVLRTTLLPRSWPLILGVGPLDGAARLGPVRRPVRVRQVWGVAFEAWRRPLREGGQRDAGGLGGAVRAAAGLGEVLPGMDGTRIF